MQSQEPKIKLLHIRYSRNTPSFKRAFWACPHCNYIHILYQQDRLCPHNPKQLLNEITSPSAVLISAYASTDFSKPSGLLPGGEDAPGCPGGALRQGPALTSLPCCFDKKVPLFVLLRGCPGSNAGRPASPQVRRR